MIESFGPRPTAPSGPAAALSAVQADEKIVQRPLTTVMPAEPVDRNAPTGPRPTFQHTYLQRLAAFWPDEPDPPTEDEEPAEDERSPASEVRAAEEVILTLRHEQRAPTVDVRR